VVRVRIPISKATVPANSSVSPRNSRNSGYEVVANTPLRSLTYTFTSSSARSYGCGRNSTAFTIEKMAVLAPMPSAMMATAVAVKPGDWRRRRAP
jgi:hypothetical protein